MIPEEPKPREARIGDNQPPSPIESIGSSQKELLTPLLERREYVISRAKSKQVVDRADVGDAGDIIKAADVLATKVDQERKELTNPLREAANRAKGIADEWLEPMLDAIADLEKRVDDWHKAEEQRIAAQEREQSGFGAPPPAASPAAPKGEAWPQRSPQRASAPAKPKKTIIRGDLGSRVTRADVKIYKVVDVHKVPDIILNSKMVHEAIIAAAKSIAKVMPEPEGIEITVEKKSNVR